MINDACSLLDDEAVLSEMARVPGADRLHFMHLWPHVGEGECFPSALPLHRPVGYNFLRRQVEMIEANGEEVLAVEIGSHRNEAGLLPCTIWTKRIASCPVPEPDPWAEEKKS